jgi:hypothetical protein
VTIEGQAFEAGATGVEKVTDDGVQVTGRKILRNGQLFILRGEEIYTLQGQKVR